MKKVERVRQHVRENKAAYISGGVCFVVGVAATVVALRDPKLAKIRAIQVLTYKSNQTIEVFIEALGDPGNIVQDLTTGVIYASQNQAAKALGVDRSMVSRHLAGELSTVKGHELIRLGKAMVAPLED